MLRKLMASALALTLLVGCSSTPTSGGTTSTGKTYNVGVAIYQFDDNFMTLYRNELESYMRELGQKDDVTYNLTIIDSKNDMTEQKHQVDNFISQKMDVIILNLVQPSAADEIIEKVVAADIPLILINREPLGNGGDESYRGILDNEKVCYVGADARQSGTFQGEIVASLPNHGDINGDGEIGYIMIKGDAENIDAEYRTEYSVKALTDAGYKVKKLDEQAGDWVQTRGQKITAEALAQYGNDVEVILSNNDAMALGALKAIEEAGRTPGQDIYVLGVDGLEECVQLVNEGKMAGTVYNDFVKQSHTAVDVAIQALNGEAIDSYYWIDYVKVTK